MLELRSAAAMSNVGLIQQLQASLPRNGFLLEILAGVSQILSQVQIVDFCWRKTSIMITILFLRLADVEHWCFGIWTSLYWQWTPPLESWQLCVCGGGGFQSRNLQNILSIIEIFLKKCLCSQSICNPAIAYCWVGTMTVTQAYIRIQRQCIHLPKASSPWQAMPTKQMNSNTKRCMLETLLGLTCEQKQIVSSFPVVTVAAAATSAWNSTCIVPCFWWFNETSPGFYMRYMTAAQFNRSANCLFRMSSPSLHMRFKFDCISHFVQVQGKMMHLSTLNSCQSDLGLCRVCCFLSVRIRPLILFATEPLFCIRFKIMVSFFGYIYAECVSASCKYPA